MRPTVLGILAALLFVVAGDSSTGRTSTSESLKRWIDGPVRYVATKEEIKAFRSLESDRARASFVEAFWSRRDPSPDTLINEYRQLFWERVQECNRLFKDAPAEGWRTDRGKVYILYGPPSNIEQDLNADTKGLPTAGRGVIRWVYEGRPGGRKDLDPVVIVPFVRDMTGEFHISYDPKLSSVFVDILKLSDRSGNVWENWLADQAQTTRSPLSVMLDLGKMQEVPSQEEILLERVDAYEALVGEPPPVRVEQFLHPASEGRAVAITVGIPSEPGAHLPAVIARLLGRESDARSYILGEDSFRIEGKGERRVAQGRLVVPIGTYKLTVLVVDPLTKTSSMHRSLLEVPGPPSDELSLSDVVLAREMEPLPYLALASYDEPFIVGKFRVVPRVDDAIPRGEAMNLYYEIYGGTLPYRVTYQIQGQEKDGRWIDLGRPVVQEDGRGAQGWSLPTNEKWPLGAYRVEILVEDAGGLSDRARLAFRVVEPPSS